MLELRRLILRGSLEIHVGDCMMLMCLLLRISWESDEFDKHLSEKRVYKEVTEDLTYRDQYSEGEILRCNPLWMISSLWEVLSEILCNVLSSMREKSEVKTLVPPSSSSYGGSWWISCKLLHDVVMICNERWQYFIDIYIQKVIIVWWWSYKR